MNIRFHQVHISAPYIELVERLGSLPRLKIDNQFPLFHKILKIYKKNLFDSKLDVIVKFENAEIIFLNTKNKTKKEFILKSKSSNIIKYKNEGIIYNNRKFAFTMKKYQKNFYIELLRYIKNNKNYNLASLKEIMYNAKIIKNILNRNSYGYH